ncbi:DUF4041 domain-containing protein [Lacticaseibacillus hegangensis]|uniref:DUF4041 domain-containing protein n=1 Tax=Lacticaseibacillus hegangensis TaxID=2486010 RepID=A0ABW4CXM1_9LACO|nr:DUF4041 domain-containing protein [Lacticaseibacillus hegangensis]
MGIADLFKTKEFKAEIERLTVENSRLQEIADLKLSAQQMKPSELAALIHEKEDELSKLEQTLSEQKVQEQSELGELSDSKAKLQSEISSLTEQINNLRKELGDVDEQVEMASYGLYKPRYDFASSLGYKDKLQSVRTEQKKMLSNQTAYNITFPLTFNNSAAKGKAIQKKNGKQLVRSFNVECEAAINKVTYSNIDRIESRITKSFAQLNKLNEGNGIELSPDYLASKKDELHLAYEYETKKQQEKEALREQREREREEAKAQKQIQEAQKQLEKDLDHYQKALSEMTEKLATLTNEEERAGVEASIEELQRNIDKAEDEKKDLDYRQQNATAGYVYIISNIGSFGPDIVKIGVTRRLDPMERIDELGSASVPFKFDVHALIFSYDAYALEAELHQRFDTQRVNKVNNRKEYFHVSIQEIKKALEEYKDLTVDFTETPDAPEYRESVAASKAQ